jgi:hypothetical protein
MPSKAQRQNENDGIGSYDRSIYANTVARVREPVTLDYPNQVKAAACIYMCG